jgi:hypothetical protein
MSAKCQYRSRLISLATSSIDRIGHGLYCVSQVSFAGFRVGLIDQSERNNAVARLPQFS